MVKWDKDAEGNWVQKKSDPHKSKKATKGDRAKHRAGKEARGKK